MLNQIGRMIRRNHQTSRKVENGSAATIFKRAASRREGSARKTSRADGSLTGSLKESGHTTDSAIRTPWSGAEGPVDGNSVSRGCMIENTLMKCVEYRATAVLERCR